MLRKKTIIISWTLSTNMEALKSIKKTENLLWHKVIKTYGMEYI